jgi:hypothetical protein
MIRDWLMLLITGATVMILGATIGIGCYKQLEASPLGKREVDYVCTKWKPLYYATKQGSPTSSADFFVYECIGWSQPE